MNAELLKEFYDDSQKWKISASMPHCIAMNPLSKENVFRAVCSSDKSFTRYNSVGKFLELIKSVVDEDPLLNSDLHELAVAARFSIEKHFRHDDNDNWLRTLHKWEWLDYTNTGMHDSIEWLYIMEQYLLRIVVKKTVLEFECRVNLLKDIAECYKKKCWEIYAKKQYGCQCWSDGEVHLYSSWNQQTWIDGGCSKVENYINSLYEEQLAFEDFSRYNVSTLEPLIGKEVFTSLQVLSAVNCSKLKVEYESAVADLCNFKNVVRQSNVGGAMRQNQFDTTLTFGHFFVKVSFSDTGKGVAALKKTKNALGTAAGAGIGIAAGAAVIACPALLAALPIAAILTGGFGRDKH